MTDTSIRRCAVLFASLLASFTACKRTSSGPAAPPGVQRSATVSQATLGQGATVPKLDPAQRRDQRPGPQPPAPPCLRSAEGEPSLPELLERAGRSFEQGRFDESLECAREASRIDGQSVAAHHFRAAALTELGRLDEARTAYARALALDPDDPEVLRSVAELHVRRLGSRDDLELALAYIRRALPRAAAGKDRTLQKDLYLLQSMALDDLGRPAEAVAAAGLALAIDPNDREAQREKGVALFELCRFAEAKQALAELAAVEPDAWAEHYLGLIAERAQDDAAAAAHFARAHELDPETFRPSPPLPSPAFAKVVREEVEKLPPEIRRGLSHTDFAVADLPDVSDLTATDPPLSPGILGLFRPTPEGAPQGARPAIFLYRRNLARAAHNDEELRREVRDTLMHEVGHLNGEDDEQLRDRGL